MSWEQEIILYPIGQVLWERDEQLNDWQRGIGLVGLIGFIGPIGFHYAPWRKQSAPVNLWICVQKEL